MFDVVWFGFGLVLVWFGRSAFVCLKEVLLAGAQVPEDNAQVSQVQREGVVVGLHNLHGAIYRSKSNHRRSVGYSNWSIFLDLRKIQELVFQESP